MRDWCRVTLIGHVGADAELKTSPEGKFRVRVRLATSTNWKDAATGEWKSQTEWHTLVAFDKAAEALAATALKGVRLMVQGTIHYNEFTKQDGTKTMETQIKVEDFGKMEPNMKVGGETITGKPAQTMYEPNSIPF